MNISVKRFCGCIKKGGLESGELPSNFLETSTVLLHFALFMVAFRIGQFSNYANQVRMKVFSNNNNAFIYVAQHYIRFLCVLKSFTTSTAVPLHITMTLDPWPHDPPSELSCITSLAPRLVNTSHRRRVWSHDPLTRMGCAGVNARLLTGPSWPDRIWEHTAGRRPSS